MARKFSIIIDTDLDLAINVNLDNRTSIIFKKFSGGLYYYEMTNTEYNIINIQVTDYNFLNTIERNKAYFHQCKIKLSDKARTIQQIGGWTSKTDNKIIRRRKSNQKIPNHDRQHQQIRVNIWTTDTHHTRKIHHKDDR